MREKDSAEDLSAEELLAAEAQAAKSIVLPPVVCQAHPRGLVIAPGTSATLLDQIALAIARAGEQLPWYAADTCRHRVEEGHRGVFQWGEKQGLGKENGLRTKKMISLRFPLEWRTVPLPFTFYRLVATMLPGFPRGKELRTAAGSEKATQWRQRGSEILEYALAMNMTTAELTKYLDELLGKAVRPDLAFLKSLSKMLLRFCAAPALLAALPSTDEVTRLMNLLAGLLRQCLDLVDGFLAKKAEEQEVDDNGDMNEPAKGEVVSAPFSRWRSGLGIVAYLVLAAGTGLGLSAGLHSYRQAPVVAVALVPTSLPPAAQTVVAAEAAAELQPRQAAVSAHAQVAPRRIHYATEGLGEHAPVVGYINCTDRPDAEVFPGPSLILAETTIIGPSRR